MKKTVFVFSSLIVALLVLFKLSEYSYRSGNLNIELLLSAIAILFFIIGIYINKKGLVKRGANPFKIDFKKLETLGISQREYEVLQQVVKGLSNKEIGEKLHLSESTIKTHVSNLLVKLDAKRRTQAIQKAKELKIISE
ncbi:response regulator transcription factor [Flagellimonas sp. S174]|uniref:response regulator transcription factor n=1 Tax=Flagellimonas sp. S174 TaxID=3410790 RepID=UPI003BF4CC57